MRQHKFNRWFKNWIPAFAGMTMLLGFSSPVKSEDLYITQTSQGTGDGSSCADAKAASFFNTDTNWSTGVGKIGAGDTIHVCGTLSSSLIFHGSGNAGNPITLLFEANAKISAPVWDLVSWERAGITTNSNSYIVIDGGTNGLVEATDVGTPGAWSSTIYHSQAAGTGVWLYSCDNCEVKNMTVTGAYRRQPLSSDNTDGGACISGSGSHVRVHHNWVSEANNGIGFNYPGGHLTEDVEIYNNTISRISNGIAFGSGNTNALADGVKIYSNEIFDEYVWDGVFSAGGWFHNDGIQSWAVHAGSRLTNMSVYSNYVHGDLGEHITGWIFLEGNIVDPLIFNNVLVSTGTSYPANGFITATGFVYNNTIAAMSGGGTGVNTKVNTEIKNNIFYNLGTPIGVHTPDGVMTDPQTKIDNNLYIFSHGFGNALVNDAGGGQFYFQSQTAWEGFGYDAHTLYTDPMFVDPAHFNFHLLSGSPAINAGDDAPHVTVLADHNGVLRPQGAHMDMGAFEFCTGSCPQIDPGSGLGGPPPTRGRSGSTGGSSLKFLPFRNVFNPAKGDVMAISFYSDQEGPKLTVYDRSGKEVRVVSSAHAGSEYQAPWDGRNAGGSVVASGTYVLVLKQGDKIAKKKVVAVK